MAAGAGVVVVLLACGLVELVVRRRGTGRGRLAVHAWPAALVVALATDLPEVAWTALKVGALSYGGGFVIIPLMQADAVGGHGWMSR